MDKFEPTRGPIGTVRRLDPLNRVVIPREYVRKMGLETGDQMEIMCYENGVFVRKYECRAGG